jgi:hypothetical protein
LYFSGEYYLNGDISNQNVLINNFTGLPATIFKQYISLFATGFYANATGPYVQQGLLINTPFQFELLELIATAATGGINWNGTGTGIFGTGIVNSNFFYCQFDNDSVAPAFDAGGNYSNITFEYTVPVTGFYAFEALVDCVIDFSVTGLTPLVWGGRAWGAAMIATDATYTTGSVLDLNFLTGFPWPANGPSIGDVQFQLSNTPALLNAGDKVFVALRFDRVFSSETSTLYLRPNSYFRLTFTNVDGGDVLQVEDGNNYLLKNEWSGNLPLPTWQQISASPFSQLKYQVNDAGEGRNMYILDMTRNLLSGETEAQLAGRLVDQVPPDFQSLNSIEEPE